MLHILLRIRQACPKVSQNGPLGTKITVFSPEGVIFWTFGHGERLAKKSRTGSPGWGSLFGSFEALAGETGGGTLGVAVHVAVPAGTSAMAAGTLTAAGALAVRAALRAAVLHLAVHELFFGEDEFCLIFHGEERTECLGRFFLLLHAGLVGSDESVQEGLDFGFALLVLKSLTEGAMRLEAGFHKFCRFLLCLVVGCPEGIVFGKIKFFLKEFLLFLTYTLAPVVILTAAGLGTD